MEGNPPDDVVEAPLAGSTVSDVGGAFAAEAAGGTKGEDKRQRARRGSKRRHDHKYRHR